MKIPVLRKILYVVSYIVGIGVPVWAVLEKFPSTAHSNGTAKTVASSSILILIIISAVWGKVILKALRQYFGWITGWVGLAFSSAILAAIFTWLYKSAKMIKNISTVCIACCVGFTMAALISGFAKFILREKGETNQNEAGND